MILAFCLAIPAALARPEVASGGDAVAYLLAARYNPLLDNFDNPSHGWGYPALVKLLAFVVGDLHRASVLISLVSLGVFLYIAMRMAREFLPSRWLWPFGVLLALQPAVLNIGSETSCDMLSAALVVASVWLLAGNRGLKGDCLAGVLAAGALFVRGNAIALLLAGAAWLLVHRNFARLAAFGGGAALVLGSAAVGALLLNVPLGRVFRSGAGELAFATLDRTGTWNSRLEYEDRFPSYLPLVRHHAPELAKTAAKTLLHVHDWWLIPGLSVLGVFVIPGFFRAGTRLTGAKLGILVLIGAVQATYLWSGRFQEVRHIIVSLPLLLALAFLGVGLLPATRRLWGRTVGFRGPVLAAAVVVTLATYAFQNRGLFSRTSGAEVAMVDAGHWLRGQVPPHQPGEGVAASRLNVAYQSKGWPVSPSDVFHDRAPQRETLASELRQAGVRWYAWLDAHSAYEYPSLKWLSTTGDFPGASLVYRRNGVSIWKLLDEKTASGKL